jgi:hypothetical protein
MAVQIYPERKILFMGNEKCAMTSCFDLFGSAWKGEGIFGKGEGPDRPLASLSYLKKSYPDYFTVTFVRNPFFRIRSYFGYARKHTKKLKINFDRFVESHTKLAPCVKFIDCECDFIGKVENFNEDIDRLCKILDVNYEKIPHSNRSTLKPYYTEKTKKIIEDYYKEDLERFNYKFPNELLRR